MSVFRMIIILSSLMILPLAASANAPAEAPIPEASPVGAASAGNPYTAETAEQHIPDCNSAQENIQYFCSQNTELELAQQRANVAGMFQAGQQGAGQTARDAETNATFSQASLRRVRGHCRAAYDRCNQTCTEEANQHRQRAVQDQMNAATHQQNAQTALDIRNRCYQEQAALQSQATAMEANLAEILAAVAQIMQALGLGQGDGSASLASADDTEEEDKCEGEYAHLLIECKDQSGPSGTRAGLSGAAALSGKTSTGLGNLFDGANGGEPGGESKGGDDDSAGGGSPFGAAGFGGGNGLGGTNAAAGGGGSGKEELDTDIQKGYMGTGGGFGGGGGGGGGGRSAGRGYNPVSPLGGAAGVNKAALQKKLNKYANSGKRNPASAGGANGPFESNWAIIKKAYKKNSSSMFHQQ